MMVPEPVPVAVPEPVLPEPELMVPEPVAPEPVFWAKVIEPVRTAVRRSARSSARAADVKGRRQGKGKGEGMGSAGWCGRRRRRAIATREVREHSVAAAKCLMGEDKCPSRRDSLLFSSR